MNALAMRLRLHAVPVLFSRSQSGIPNQKNLANSISVARRITRTGKAIPIGNRFPIAKYTIKQGFYEISKCLQVPDP